MPLKGSEVAKAAHRLGCRDTKQHSFLEHMATSSYYAEYLNAREIDVQPEDVIYAIFRATNWTPDSGKPWPGHPHPDLVIKELGNGSRDT